MPIDPKEIVKGMNEIIAAGCRTDSDLAEYIRNGTPRRDPMDSLPVILKSIRDRLTKSGWRDQGHQCESRSAIHAAVQMIDHHLKASTPPASGSGDGKGEFRQRSDDCRDWEEVDPEPAPCLFADRHAAWGSGYSDL